MDLIFEIEDRYGRKVYLSKERWKHILSEHPYMINKLEDIKDTIICPLTVKGSKYDEKVRFYYKQFKENKKYLFVPVKYLNGKGFIITSFFVRNLVK